VNCQHGGRETPQCFEILASGIEAEKFRRRLTCALSGLGWSARIRVQDDPLRALDLGARSEPALLIDGRLVAEGMQSTEALESLLRPYLGQPKHSPAP
jgi:predicted DsbA family dithiol-disulfide isomerase